MKMINLLAALLLAALATTTAHAATDPYVVNNTIVSPDCTDWNPGAAPFAATETESVEKLPSWLSVLVQQGKIQPGDIDFILKAIHDNPMGTPSTIIRGAHFDFMASSEKGKPVVSSLCYNPDDNPGRTKDGFAISYKALNALTWVIDLPGNRRLLFNRFFVCYNWAGEWMDVPPPPPPVIGPEPECAELDVTVPPGGYVLHSGLFARRQLGRKCREIFGDGRAILCDQCSADDALNELRGKGYLLNSQPNNGFKFKCNSPSGCVLRMHEPISATVVTDDDIFWLCLTGQDGSALYLLKDVHWYSFKRVNGILIAYVGDAPADWIAAGGVPRIWHEVKP